MKAQQIVTRPSVPTSEHENNEQQSSTKIEKEAIHAVELVSMSLGGVLSEDERALAKRVQSGPLKPVADNPGASDATSTYYYSDFIEM
jgi:hypothetical protein